MLDRRITVGDFVKVTSRGKHEVFGLRGIVLDITRDKWQPVLVTFQGWGGGHGVGQSQWWLDESDLTLLEVREPSRPCKYAKRYMGKHPPKCNHGKPCQACVDIFASYNNHGRKRYAK